MWNIAVIKAQMMGWDVNNDLGSYDRTKVNFVAAANDDYTEAGKAYISGQKVTLKMIENGKYTGKDTTVGITGVGSWFPVDQQIVQEKGGMVTLASTAEYGSQMGCAILMIGKWAEENRSLVEKFVEGTGRAGDQIKSHDGALRFACEVNELVFADKTKSAEDWYNAYKSFPLTDEDGNEVSIGGSRAFSLADAAAYTGIAGGSDTYKKIYNTFSQIGKEAYPERIGTVTPYEDATDFSFLKAVYAKAKAAGTAGTVSKTDFTETKKGSVIGDAAYQIEFDLGSATIKPSSFATLDKIIGQLSVVDNAFLEIGGHTDATGNPSSNQELSERRAQSVKAYLVSKAKELSAAGRTSVRGYGSNQPITGVDGLDGRNRRVTIKLFKAN